MKKLLLLSLLSLGFIGSGYSETFYVSDPLNNGVDPLNNGLDFDPYNNGYDPDPMNNGVDRLNNGEFKILTKSNSSNGYAPKGFKPEGATTGAAINLNSLFSSSGKWSCPSGSKRDLENGCVKGFVANLFEGKAALNKGDYETAIKHFDLLAKGGSANAQFYIGKMYEEGISFKKNDYWAHHWINKAAQLGLPDAQYTLGYFYRNGVGVVKDSTQTVKWFNKAGTKGHPKAQFNLGAMYINGDTVSKSLKEAKYWINLAIKSNHPRAEAIWNDFELWKY
ncbi:sel1 repeat family protein [Candidatus Thioglobus sp.]|nr:sel1 repeat family protein [Candidatus Thioglobus sp.]